MLRGVSGGPQGLLWSRLSSDSTLHVFHQSAPMQAARGGGGVSVQLSAQKRLEEVENVYQVSRFILKFSANVGLDLIVYPQLSQCEMVLVVAT